MRLWVSLLIACILTALAALFMIFGGHPDEPYTLLAHELVLADIVLH